MNWRHSALPPLLRGVGTALVVVASVMVGIAEHREGKVVRAAIEQAHQRIALEAQAAVSGGGQEALIREVKLLRMQAAENTLASQVFANPWFQLLGALGTLLVALSFLLEAWQRWREHAPAPDDPAP